MRRPLEAFYDGGSPYFFMYKAGLAGYDISDVMAFLDRLDVPVREKDIRNWENGNFKYRMTTREPFDPVLPERLMPTRTVVRHEEKLTDFPEFPDQWHGCSKRFFPCTDSNKPMQKWGWSADYTPQLYDEASARALSPCSWVGQNMIYQRFIVLDIDGVGHGERDEQVIAFGEKYKHQTFCMEDPAKPGSFHLYFSTSRIIPVMHFPWAKLDFMGNATNAAVYLKNKQGNGLPMMELTEAIWEDMIDYQKSRKESLQ